MITKMTDGHDQDCNYYYYYDMIDSVHSYIFLFMPENISFELVTDQ